MAKGMDILGTLRTLTITGAGFISQPATSPAPAPLDLAALLGPRAWARLPAAVQRRFAADHGAATYLGTMDLDCSAIGGLLAWLARPLRGPLVADRLTGVPARVDVRPDGRGGVIWSRTLGGHVVGSTKSTHPQGGVLERTTGGLAMELDVFEADGALVFESRRFVWIRGRLTLPLPSWLTPGRCRVEHRDLGAGRFRFTLAMTHPLWGETFHQTGDFIDPVKECRDAGV